MEAVVQHARTDTEQRSSSGSSLSAALSRSLASSASFYFSRPIRLFRPTKVSGLTAMQALAHERGKTLSPSTLRSILKEEGWRIFPRHVFPPFVANTMIGFSLFFVYSTSDFVFRKALPDVLPEPAVPFVCGALAGGAQSIISSPLDNVRMLLARRAEGAKFSWALILKEALFPVFLVGTPPAESKSRFAQLRGLTRWASRGWSLFSLSLARDSLGFGCFFAIFEQGRKWAARAGNAVDRSLASKSWPKWLTGRTEEEKKSRGWIGRAAQALILVAAGSLAGLSYGVIGRPFDVARHEIWQGRMSWAEKQGLGSSPAPESAKAAASEAPAPPRNRLARMFGSSFLKRRSPASATLPQLPSARSILRQTIAQRGVGVFFAPLSSIMGARSSSRLDSHPSLGGASVFSAASERRVRPPPSGSGLTRLGSAAVRFFSIVPPYSLGFLAYACFSGDLSEVN